MGEPECLICRSWPRTMRFTENDLFEMIRVSVEDSALVDWLSVFQQGADLTNVSICEVHFIKEDYVREYDEKGLPLLKLINESVTPTFVNYEECFINNQIGSYTDFLMEYHKCLNTQPNWNMEATEDEVTFMLKNFEVVIRVKSSMMVVVQDGSSTFEQGSILESHLNNGIVEYWSKMRGLMLFCEENSPLTEVMARLGATVVLEGNDDDMFSSLDDVLCYVKTVLDETWFYEIFNDANYIVGFQVESRGSPKITKAIKIYPDFTMVGYVNGEIVGTKNPGTIRFLQSMCKEEVLECNVNDVNDEANWNAHGLDTNNADHIHSFDSLVENISEHLRPQWKSMLLEHHLLLYKDDMKGIPKLRSVIKFNKKLNCSIYLDGVEIFMNAIVASLDQSVLTFTMIEAMIEVVNELERRTNMVEEGEMEEGEIAPEPRNVKESVNKRPLNGSNNSRPPFKKIRIQKLSNVQVISTTNQPITSKNLDTPSTSFSCPECGEPKATQNALTRHMIKHKSEFTCQLCSQKFKTPADLRLHMDSKHAVTHKYECPDCELQFFVETELQAHINDAHKYVKFYIKEIKAQKEDTVDEYGNPMCHICLSSFTHKANLIRHLRAMHTTRYEIESKRENGQNFFLCKVCNAGSVHYKLMVNHVQQHTNVFENAQEMDSAIVINPEDAEEELILGGNPDLGTVNEEDQGDVSETNNQYELVYGEDFQEDLNLNQDEEFLISEEPNEDGLWHCHLCLYKGKSKKLLKNHGLYHKSNYRCAICSRYYPSQFHLKRHMNTHLNEVHDVSVLGNAFSEPDSLIQIDDSNDIEIKEENY